MKFSSKGKKKKTKKNTKTVHNKKGRPNSKCIWLALIVRFPYNPHSFKNACFHSIRIDYLCETVWNCYMLITCLGFTWKSYPHFSRYNKCLMKNCCMDDFQLQNKTYLVSLNCARKKEKENYYKLFNLTFFNPQSTCIFCKATNYNPHPFSVGFSVVGETTSVGQSLRHLQ